MRFASCNTEISSYSCTNTAIFVALINRNCHKYGTAAYKRVPRAPDPAFFPFAARVAIGSSFCFAMAEEAQNFDDELQARLSDPVKRLELWHRMQSASNHNSLTPGRA